MLGTLQSRPSESGGVAAALALLIAHFAGLHDDTTILSLAVVIGFVPAAITWAVTLIRARGGRGAGP